MHSGAQNVFLPNTDWVREAMGQVRPTLMCAVPRFYEKIFSAVQEKVARAPWLRRALFHWAIVCGERKFLQERAGKPLGKVFDFTHRWADKLVLSKLRGILGGRVRFLPAAGAKLDDNVILFSGDGRQHQVRLRHDRNLCDRLLLGRGAFPLRIYR